jgi:hypothetical protein
VITAGALAVAISAIIALVPKGTAPPSAFRASFIPPIQVYPNTTLDEYAARVQESTTASVTTPGGGRLPSYHLAADVTQIVTTSDSTDSSDSLGAGSSDTTSSSETTTDTATETTDTSTPTSTSSSCTDSSDSSGGTGSTTTSDTCSSPNVNLRVSRAGSLRVFGNAADVQTAAQQIELVRRCPLGAHETSGGGCLPDSTLTCPPTGCVAFEPESYDPGPGCVADIRSGRCGAAALIAKALSDGDEPPAAARKVVGLFAASRGERTGSTVHPLGVMITFSADLIGFVGARATLRWSLFSRDPNQHLDPEWYRTIAFDSVSPTTNEYQFSDRFWVPEPRRRGDYYVVIEVDGANGQRVAFLPSPDFH